MPKYPFIVFFTILFLAGCGGEKPEVLVVLKTLDNPFFVDIQDGFVKEWGERKQDAVVTIKSGRKEGDIETQRKILDAQYSSKVANRQPPLIKGLVLTPSASGGDLVLQIRRYRKAGIPVILLDTGINREELERQKTNYNLLVRSNNVTGGEIAADVLVKGLEDNAKECRVLVLNGVADHDTAKERRDGFVQKAESMGCEVAMEKTANWRRDDAQRIVSQLVANWKFTGVFAANDEMALGTISALKQAGINDGTLIVGFDAIPEAIEAVRSGLMLDTIAQNPRKMGKKAAMALAEFITTKAKKKKLPSFKEELLSPVSTKRNLAPAL
uniref:Ribose transport system substrate-binding protein n=1 Tax=Candidatus Kentrum sp. FM TaxID=2126340 RepID=A0A450SH01_9GAMM|nr:MAG: ribose transport system substrate-binding protein [Candidatus Kentron sp. FM]VFJ52411.1 MAG: ribose transport system substrate-binding protein [Candidatus Kentron sp. FM]VFK07705.1 MAG: ribose transport system substrate-binding protein [Candidatus Kentron sp. FM]